MTLTATYLAEENCLQELPRMKKPDDILQDGFYNSGYEEQMEAYRYHLATLRKIPCSPEPGFKDGEKYTEGKDYEIKGTGDWKWCYQLKGNIFAFPLVPAGEDELWEEVMRFLKNETGFRQEYVWKMIDKLKSEYIITKR